MPNPKTKDQDPDGGDGKGKEIGESSSHPNPGKKTTKPSTKRSQSSCTKTETQVAVCAPSWSSCKILLNDDKSEEALNLLDQAALDYMENQPDINEMMRGILIDWLIEVHCKFELIKEPVYLTINLIDEIFAVHHHVARKKLQLVGVTAMLLACKYEEVSVPVVDDRILISDKTYTRREILDMEKLMANTLQFNFCLPTPYVFMRRYLKAVQSDKKVELLSFFINELGLVDYEMLQYTPSQLAASAIYTDQSTIKGFKEWSEFCTGYTEEKLLQCLRKMVGLHHKAGTGKLTGVHSKYNTSKFGYAARTTAPAGFLLL